MARAGTTLRLPVVAFCTTALAFGFALCVGPARAAQPEADGAALLDGGGPEQRDAAPGGARLGEGAELTALRARCASPADALDAGTVDVAAACSEEDRARLVFLELPPEERERVEAERRREEELAAERAAAELARLDAERAREEARAQARAAASVAARDLAEARVALESVRLELATVRDRIAQQQQQDSETAEARRTADDALAASARSANGTAADALYATVVATLQTRRGLLGAAIDALQTDLTVPTVPSVPDITAPDLLADREALIEQRRSLLAESASLAQSHRAARWETASALAVEVRQLNELRISLLDVMSDAGRREVLGFGREGLRQLLREVAHARLMVRWYPYARGASFNAFQHAVQDVFNLGTTASFLVRALLLLAVSVILARRRVVWIARLRSGMSHAVRSATWRRWLDGLGAAVEQLSGELLLLAVMLLVFEWLLGSVTLAEVAIVGTVLEGFAWYRVLSRAVHILIVAIARSDRRRLRPETSAKLLASVRLIGRVALALYVVRLTAAAVLGRGYLYHLVVDVTFVSALPIAWLLLHRWRPDITTAYLGIRPDGGLARAVERTRGRSYGMFIALAAFSVLAVRGVVDWMRERLLSLEQTRRALAYFFRRRLEARAEADGALKPPAEEKLPPAWRAAFAGTPTDAPLTDALPHLTEVAEAIATRRAAGRGTGVALVAEPGMGKTTWMRALARKLGEPNVHLVTLRGRVDAARLRDALAAVVGRTDSTEELARACAAHAGHVFLLDECERLFLRDIDAYSGFRAMMELVSQASARCSFVLSFSAAAYRTMLQVVPRGEAFHRQVTLEPWSEDGVGALLRGRTQVAGITPRFEDLVIDEVGGAAYTAAVVRTAHGFERLVWDYADGNPRLALHFWLRSLIPLDAKHARVVLFDAPASDALDDLTAAAREVLSTIHRHDRIMAPEIARVLRIDEAWATSITRELIDRAVITDEAGELRIATHWDRAVFKFLKRSNLLD